MYWWNNLQPKLDSYHLSSGSHMHSLIPVKLWLIHYLLTHKAWTHEARQLHWLTHNTTVSGLAPWFGCQAHQASFLLAPRKGLCLGLLFVRVLVQSEERVNDRILMRKVFFQRLRIGKYPILPQLSGLRQGSTGISSIQRQRSAQETPALAMLLKSWPNKIASALAIDLGSATCGLANGNSQNLFCLFQKGAIDCSCVQHSIKDPRVANSCL